MQNTNNKYNHIAVLPDTFAQIKQLQQQLKAKNRNRKVTYDDVLYFLLEKNI